MAIVVARIDERLVHGQVAYSWSVAYDTDTILVADDAVGKDDIQKMLMGMAVPKGKKGIFLTVDEAAAYFAAQKDLHQKIFLVARGPEPYLKLVESGAAIKSINVGGMYYREDRKQLSKTVYVSQSEAETFGKLRQLGVQSEIRTAPKDKSQDLYALLD